MENRINNINTNTLRSWLEQGKPVVVLDVRPTEQRSEWFIPGSVHVDVYEKLKQKKPDALNGIDFPQETPIVTVCAAGKTSEIAAEQLMRRGYEVYSLEGGMKAWSISWNTAELQDKAVTIIQVRRTGKGCLSYIIGSEDEAVVIDSSVDVEVYQNLAKSKGWNIKYVLDTHIHADHLSRTSELAKATGAALYLPDQDKVRFDFNKLLDGDVLQVGTSVVKAIHTPGHTLDSMSYLLNDHYVFTGDTLFTDGVGRPDLKADEKQLAIRASKLFTSLKNLARLDPQILVFPGHISKPVAFDQKIISASIGDIRNKVAVLNLSKNDFVKTILSKIPPTPPNYLKITDMNLLGDMEGVNVEELEAGANRCAIS